MPTQREQGPSDQPTHGRFDWSEYAKAPPLVEGHIYMLSQNVVSNEDKRHELSFTIERDVSGEIMTSL